MKTVYLDIYGLQFIVTVEIDIEGVCDVRHVEAVAENGQPVTLKCETDEFYKAFDGFLDEALKQALIEDAIDAYEMKMDSKREEGNL